jgi:hypothetical protein
VTSNPLVRSTLRSPAAPAPGAARPWVGRRSGRPRKWCSQKCRRAVYEERRASAAGAIAVRDVEVTLLSDHDLSTCAQRVTESPTAMKRVLRSLGEQRRIKEVASDLRWQPARNELVMLIGKLEHNWARHVPRRWR